MRNAISFVGALFLAGCTSLPFAPKPTGELEKNQAIELLSYSQHFAAMTMEQQLRELDATNKEYARNDETASRVRLALILATIGGGVRDTARAASLLEPLAKSADPAGPVHSLAAILYILLIDHANEQARSTRLRSQLESRADVERKLREQLAASKEAERTMREQLDALKEVERTIMRRRLESQPRRK
jgi:hypothetical protein